MNGMKREWPLAIVMIAGSVTLVGWLLDIPILETVLPGAVSMKISTASSFVLCAMMLFLSRKAQEHEMSGIGAMFFGVQAFTWHGGILLQQMTKLPMGFGGASGSETMSVAPGIPSLATSFCFLLIVASSILNLPPAYHEPLKNVWAIRISKAQLKLRRIFRIAPAVVGLIGAIAILGYVVEEPRLYWHSPGTSTAMAIHTAVAFILLAIAMRGRWKSC